MDAPPPDRRHAEALASARTALRGVCLALPHLSGLAHEVRLEIEPRCSTAGVFASGRLIMNPEWWLALQPPEALFVMAHELLHLALDSHGRRGDEDPWLVNVAHDYIINDILEDELDQPPPANGLRWHGARERSLEQMIAELKTSRALGWEGPASLFAGHPATAGRPLGSLSGLLDQALGSPEGEQAGLPPDPRDVLSEELERDWYPGEAPGKLAARRHLVRLAATKAASLRLARGTSATAWDHVLRQREAGNECEVIEALRSAYRPPWEIAMQRWFDSQGDSARTYARASRRGALRNDGIVLPGRSREGWTLHLVLDTSGSMYHLLRPLMGTIASFAEGNHLGQIHLIQADGHPPIDEWLETEELARAELRGFGDGDLVAPLEHLAGDPLVESVLVVTDSYEPYPSDPPPFRVLWVLPEAVPSFQPGYGEIIVLPEEAWLRTS